MKRLSICLTAMVLVFATSCKDDKKKDNMNEETQMEQEDASLRDARMKSEEDPGQKVVVELEPKSGSDVNGEVVFWEEDGKVMMEATVTGLAEGMHAIHIHEKADCSAADASSAGGHWNPTHQPHGKWGSEEGFHRGDIGNFETNAEGKGTISMSTDLWCIGCGDKDKDILGHAIIVHEGVDDYTSQPSGAAGGRVACGGIIKM